MINIISTLKVTAYATDNTYYVQNNLKKLAVEIVDGYLVTTVFFINYMMKRYDGGSHTWL